MTNLRIPIHSKTKALIFDIDGTLLDTMQIHYKATQLACAEHGFDFPLDFFYATAGTPTHEVFEMLGKKLNINANFKQAAIDKEEIYKTLASEIKPLGIVEEIVKHYHGILPMVCGTGGTREIATLNLEASSMGHYFETVITCNDVSNPKPHPETFLKGAEFLGIAPEFCQVFEDADLGLQAAKSAGMIPTDIRLYL